jgi:hypothetical protein
MHPDFTRHLANEHVAELHRRAEHARLLRLARSTVPRRKPNALLALRRRLASRHGGQCSAAISYVTETPAVSPAPEPIASSMS